VALVAAVVPLVVLQIPDAIAWALPPRVTAAGPTRVASLLRASGLALPVMAAAAPLGALAVRRLFAFRPQRGLRVAGLTSLVTPVDQYYQMDKVLQYPQVGPPEWMLTVDGMVEKPLRLDYGAMLERPAVHRYVTTECVDNPIGGSLMSTALWTVIVGLQGSVPELARLGETNSAEAAVVLQTTLEVVVRPLPYALSLASVGNLLNRSRGALP